MGWFRSRRSKSLLNGWRHSFCVPSQGKHGFDQKTRSSFDVGPRITCSVFGRRHSHLENIRDDCSQHGSRANTFVHDPSSQVDHTFQSRQVNSSFIEQTCYQLRWVRKGSCRRIMFKKFLTEPVRRLTIVSNASSLSACLGSRTLEFISRMDLAFIMQ